MKLVNVKEGKMFQFPSNGKVYSKVPERLRFSRIAGVSFNSLQTGKCIARETAISEARGFLEFQFPSNGKVYSKQPTATG